MTEEGKARGALRSGFLTYPRGRYEEYEEKIRRLYVPLLFIIKHKIAIISLLLALSALTLALLFCTGIFVGELSCSDIAYGDVPHAHARALFCDVVYEFTDASGESWSSEIPSRPGEYRVRAVSENPLGMKRYSEEGALTIMRRQLNITLEDSYCQYGSYSHDFLVANTYAAALAQGDRISEIEYSESSESWDLISAEPHSPRILNVAGEDVTSYYDISFGSGEIRIVPRNITVRAIGGSKIYDAQPWDGLSYGIISGSLAGNDSIELGFDVLPVLPGSYPVTISSYKISDADGNDISYKYNVTLESDTLEIKKRPLHFTTGSAEKTFDNTALTNSEWTLTSGTLLEGHILEAYTYSKITYAGEKYNNLAFSIRNNIGDNVSQYYNITCTPGTLKVNPIVLYINTPSAEKVYDGLYLTAIEYEFVGGDLPEGYSLQVLMQKSIVNVGSIENTPTVVVLSDKKANVTEGFEIKGDFGTLTITPIYLEFTSSSAEKVYDGTPLTKHKFDVYSDEVAQGQVLEYTFTGKQTEVGESENTFTVKIVRAPDAPIYSTYDFTSNYVITCNYGTLRVLPNDSGGEDDPSGGDEIGSDINRPDSSTVGTPDGSYDDVVYAKVKVNTSREGEFRIFLRQESFGDYNGKGFDKASPYITKINGEYTSPIDYIGFSAKGQGSELDSLYLKRMEGCGLLIPYFTYNAGDLFGINDSLFDSEIEEYTLEYIDALDMLGFASTLTLSESLTKQEDFYSKYVYSEYMQIPEKTKVELIRLGQAKGVYQSVDKVSLIPQIQNFIMNAANYNDSAAPIPEDVDDVVIYFLTESKEGVCSHFAAAATMMMRAYGIPARYTVGFTPAVKSGVMTDVLGHTAHAWVEVYLDGYGWIPIEVTGWNTDNPPIDNPVTPPVDTRQELTLTAFSASKEYDGMPFGELAGKQFAITSGSLRPGHIAVVTISVSSANRTIPGTYKNKITKAVILDANGLDVTDQYKLTLIDGEMVIKKRKISIRTASESKVYDGKALKNETWWIVSGSLLNGHSITAKDWASLSQVGTTLNQCTINISNSKGLINAYYDITVLPGTLEITNE